MVDPQGYPRFLVGPSDAFHVCQISPDEHRGRESGQKISIDVALHSSLRRPKVVSGGCDLHVFHDYPLVHATTRPTSSYRFMTWWQGSVRFGPSTDSCHATRNYRRSIASSARASRAASGIARAAIPGRVAAAGCDSHHRLSG